MASPKRVHCGLARLMAKALRIAAIVVAVAAAIPTGGTSLIGLAGISATAASAIAFGLTFASALLTKKPSLGGTQTNFRIDPNAAVPIVFGRTLVGGDIRYRKQHGSKNKFETFTTVLSGCGPIGGILETRADKAVVPFAGMAATGKLGGRVWQDTQVGLCPEPAELNNGKGPFPGWTTAHKLSGYAAVQTTLAYDGKGDNTLVQTPKLQWLIDGVFGYDPRLDSTYPGGEGPQRWDDEATWVWTRNPYVAAITFAIGWHQGPDQIRVGGVGMPFDAIDLPSYVEGANVADANGWRIDGQVTTADDKWEVLKTILQAGGGEPVRNGALLSCIVNTPRLSIATIARDDLIGEASVTTTQTRRDRINGIIPKYRSADHDYEMVAAGCVLNSTYLAQDGAERTKEITYQLVQADPGENPDQAAQLAAYDIVNAREAGPIVLPLKLRWLGFRAGDCLTIGDGYGFISGRTVIVLRRALDPNTGSVTLTLRTEDPAKHAWALSRVGVPAPTTENSVPIDFEPPDAGDWTATAVLEQTDAGLAASIDFEGEIGDPNAPGVYFDYREVGAPEWTAAGGDRVTTRFRIAGLDPAKSYDAAVRYWPDARLELGPFSFDTAALAPDQATLLTADGNAGSADIGWRNPERPFGYVRIYSGTTDSFGAAVEIAGPIGGGLGEMKTHTHTAAAGVRYYWVRSFSATDVPSTPTGPVSAVIT